MARYLYKDSYVYEHLIATNMAMENPDISIDIDSSGYIIGSAAYGSLPREVQDECYAAAKKISDYLIKKEPSLLKKHWVASIIDANSLSLLSSGKTKLNKDRRTLIFTNDTGKEIGLLIKYNPIVRHTRVTRPEILLDSLYGLQVKESYIDKHMEQMPAVTYEECIADKEGVYIKFINYARMLHEFAINSFPDAPKLLIQSLIGSTDHYAVDISNTQRAVRIRAFNMNGTLNTTLIPYPTQLLDMPAGNYSTSSFKNNMLTIIFDGGWMVTMRVHNATLIKENIRPVDFKYDVQLKGIPYRMEEEIIPLEIE